MSRALCKFDFVVPVDRCNIRLFPYANSHLEHMRLNTILLLLGFLNDFHLVIEWYIIVLL
jgi:hypothetical protein